MLIKLFEGPISVMLRNNDQFVTLSDEQVQTVARVGLCSENVLIETAHTVESILHDCVKDGLPTILNRIQLSKNQTLRNQHLESLGEDEVSFLWANGLNSVIASAPSKQKQADALEELEQYATLLDNLSEIQSVDARVMQNVDRLVYEDFGFLKTYDDFSFCSTAQVQTGNITQAQSQKVVTQNGIAPVQPHEMQEPMIAKIVQTQTATAEGLADTRPVRVMHNASEKQSLNWFHATGSLATERQHKMRLLASCYLPKKVS